MLHGRMFTLLRQEPSFKPHAETQTFIRQLQKELQRGQKFFALCNAPGTEVLTFVPEISVSRIDKIRLSELEKLRDGSIERVNVEEIIKASANQRLATNGSASVPIA